MEFPLEGVRVVCFAELYPGPYAAALMADMGANVIQVERPTGDQGRQMPDFFATFARGKRSVVADLKDDRIRERLRPLLEKADIVLEGFSPGTAARLQVDYDSVRAINPGVIYASITGFGQTGPYRDRVGHDLSYQSIVGLLEDQYQDPRAVPTAALGDVSGSLFALVGILAALEGHHRTGQGTYIDVSMTDCLVASLAPWIAPALNGRTRIDVGERAPANALFKTSDGRVLSLSIVQEDHFWRELCVELGLHEYMNLSFDERADQSDRLREAVTERIAGDTMSHWTRRLASIRVAWAPVNSLEDVAEDPHFATRGMFPEIRGEDGQPMRVVGTPLKFSHYRSATSGSVPGLGEATEELLGGIPE
ncbi:CoA transferase [Streptomyces sp. NPDC005549]|uniref:CaiB/BaiF CoA transferase family protein n=1 Tax=Streptomyces sp. NPDC005549 TaxID=3154888 RepID=UPI0033AA4E42